MSLKSTVRSVFKLPLVVGRHALAITVRLLSLASIAVFAVGCGALAIGYPLPALVLGFLVLVANKPRLTSGNYGTARWAEADDLEAAGLFGDSGLVIGRWLGSKHFSVRRALRILLKTPISKSAAACRAAFSGYAPLVRLSHFTHLLVCSPPGGGKGVSFCLPNALLYTGSIVVNDTKGEIYTISADVRRRIMGHTIVRLDPAMLGGPQPDSLNPLDLIIADAPDALERCADLAEAIIVTDEHITDDHWVESARKVVKATIAFVAHFASEHDRNLQSVLEILASPARFQAMLEMSIESPHCGGMLAREALSCMHFRDKELNSVMTTANRNLSCFNSTAMMDAISKTTFDLSSLRSGRITIYLMLPEHQLRTGSPYLRLMITTLIRAATKNGPGEGNPITFMLDEAATLKRMPILNDAVQLLRGYGIRMIFVFQALAQIKDAFGDESQFLQSVATQLYFGTNDYETAESISRRIGDTTIEVVSKQSGWSQSRSNTKIFDPQQQSGQYSTSGSTTVSEASRRLLQASELLTMSPNAMVVFHKAMPPICLQRTRYFVDPEFAPRRLGRSERLGLVTLARSIVIAVLSVGFAFVSIEHVFGPHAFFPNQRAASAASSPEFSRPERSARTRSSGSSRRLRSPRNVRGSGIILP